MKTLLKKVVAIASIAALVTINSAYAAGLSLTGSSTSLSLTGSVNPIAGETASGTLSVDVTATVLPTLTFDISSDALNLGDLVIDAYKTVDTPIIYTGSTNAIDGMTVQVKSSGLNDGQGNNIGYNAAVSQGSTDYRFGNTAINANTDGIAFDGNDQLLDSVNSNETFSDSFHIGALIDNQTVAGNYTDTLTFTVTGTF